MFVISEVHTTILIRHDVYNLQVYLSRYNDLDIILDFVKLCGVYFDMAETVVNID